jgi:hypothetical protein
VEILILEVDLVFLDTVAMVDHFSCHLDQVDIHFLLFQLHGSKFVFTTIFKLKNEALGRSKKRSNRPLLKTMGKRHSFTKMLLEGGSIDTNALILEYIGHFC